MMETGEGSTPNTTSIRIRPRVDTVANQAARLSAQAKGKELNIKDAKVILGLWENYRTGLPITPHLIRNAQLDICAPNGNLLKSLKNVDVLVCHGRRAGIGPLIAFDGQPIQKVVDALRKSGYRVDALAICNKRAGNETSTSGVGPDIEGLYPPVIYSKNTEVNVRASINPDATITIGLQPPVGGGIVNEQFDQYQNNPSQ